MLADLKRVNIERCLEMLTSAYAVRCHRPEAASSCWLVIDPNGSRANQLLTSFDQHVSAEGGLLIAGAWRENLLRPYGGILELVDRIASVVLEDQPELLARYNLSLVNLLPAWRRVGFLRGTRLLRSGLANFVLHKDKAGLSDFYWKRDVATGVIADLIHFMLDSASAIIESTGSMPVYFLQDLHLANPLALSTLRLLNNYASRAPVLICATTRRLSEQDRSLLAASSNATQGWSIVELSGSPDESEWMDTSIALRIAPNHLEFLQAASVLILPFDLSTLLRLVPQPLHINAEEVLEALTEERVIRLYGKERYGIPSARLRDVVYNSLSADQLKQLHSNALTVESVDPFAAAWHSISASLRPEISRYSLQALEQAWAVSDYDCAVALAEHCLAAMGQGQINGDVLMALIHYEACRYEEVERFLLQALTQWQLKNIDDTTLKLLLGYNVVFGLNDFDRGRMILQEVLNALEEEGRHEEAGAVRNSIAFALARAGKTDDAIEMEKLTLALIESPEQTGGGLASILRLNLGRLYRNLGFSDQALAFLKKAMDEQNNEFSPYMLLIFHSTLAQLHTARREYTEALNDYHHCLAIARDLKLEHVSYPILNLLSSPVGLLPSGCATRGDEVLYYLYVSLALACRRLGLNNRASAYLDGMRSSWKFLCAEVFKKAEETLNAVKPTPVACKQDEPHGFEKDSHMLLHRFAHLVQKVTGGERLVDGVAEALANKQAVAFVRPREIARGIHLVDGLVLYDPREILLAKRINAEIDTYNSPMARTALLLPEAIEMFSGLSCTPLVVQEASIKPRYRNELPALVPVRIRLQVLLPEFDGIIFNLLQAFAERSRTGVLAAVPFHLRERDLAITPQKAISSYLVSSIDCLVLGDSLLRKVYGITADENLLPFRPRLSKHAAILEKSNNAEEQNTFMIMIRIWAYHSCMRLHDETRAILNLCDGKRSVADIAHHLETEFEGIPNWKADVSSFFRNLWRNGAIIFEEPIFQ